MRTFKCADGYEIDAWVPFAGVGLQIETLLSETEPKLADAIEAKRDSAVRQVIREFCMAFCQLKGCPEALDHIDHVQGLKLYQYLAGFFE